MNISNTTVQQLFIYNTTTTIPAKFKKDFLYYTLVPAYIVGTIFGLCAILCRCCDRNCYRHELNTPPVNRPLVAKYSYDDDKTDAPPPSYEVAISELYKTS